LLTLAGTGKTTAARKIGQVFYDLGLLSKPDVVECSAKDLIGEYVGQTAPKTMKQLELGLGKVLFIDEAYRLGEANMQSKQQMN
jgi:AAA+ superfamily predicted ATPase